VAKKMIQIISFILMLVCGLYLILIFTGFGQFSGKNYPVNQLKSNSAFHFVKGRPWALIKIGGVSKLALVDTGAGFPSISKDFLNDVQATYKDEVTLSTALGSRTTKWANAGDVEFADHLFTAPPLLMNTSSESVVGASLIFKLPHLILSKEGISYGKRIDDNDPRVIECLGVSVDMWREYGEVTALYLHMNINGEIQPVFLDTGSDSMLLGTVNDKVKKGAPAELPRFAFIRSVGMSPRFVKYYSRSADIKIGDKVHSFEYPSYPSRAQNDVRYFLGGPVLEHYSIYIDYLHGRACFLSR
jgi:hypothetical protein